MKCAYFQLTHLTDEEKREEYHRVARKFALHVRLNGLAQALACLTTRGRSRTVEMQQLLLQHLSQWVLPQLMVRDSADLFEVVRVRDSAFLREATLESLRYVGWLIHASQTAQKAPEVQAGV